YDQYPWGSYHLGAQIIITSNPRQTIRKRIFNSRWLLNRRLQLNLEIDLLSPPTIWEWPPSDKTSVNAGIVLVPPSHLATDTSPRCHCMQIGITEFRFDVFQC